MPYLSRIWLNPLRTATQRLLNNPHRLHATVLGGLSRQPVTERVLWRLERDNPHRAAVLVLTQSTPSWEHLIEQAGWPAADEPQAMTKSYQPLLDRIAAGAEFAFRLLANPVQSTRTPQRPSPAQRSRLAATDRPRGARVAHRTATHQLDWFTTRVTTWGFDIPHTTAGAPDLRLAARDRLVFTKNTDARHTVTLHTATYEGRLRINDADLARTSLLNGVGHARAYGCGLITLAPLPTTGDR